ncbi:MAG TPA: IclR family transcriptional regulator [Steroidobacteraceae bacterium]|nr:IclR family transcriptional regulator [Steroidobacteraceae bacterium]
MANPASGKGPPPGDGYVQSFARGLRVIRSFGSARPRMTLSEVAANSAMTRAGARRILLTLQGLGYVESDGKRFALTPRVLDLGFAYLSSMPIWNRAEPVMEALVEKVKESCSAAVLDGTDIVYVLRVPTRKIMTIDLSVGSRLPAYCTSMGRVLLAGLPDDDLVRLLRASRPRPLTKHTVTDVDELLTRIKQVRRQGWSIVNQELEEGLLSVAAPIYGHGGRLIAAINVSGQANRTNARVAQELLLPPVLEAAQTISAGLRGL